MVSVGHLKKSDRCLNLNPTVDRSNPDGLLNPSTNCSQVTPRLQRKPPAVARSRAGIDRYSGVPGYRI
jgi:hypothetical protein